jgi:hypothetical protein
MKLVAEGGLWTTGPQVTAPPAVAVLEIAGAVLEWPVDDPAGTAKITFTDIAAADWLWRVAGERGHVAVVEAVHGRTADTQTSIDIADLELSHQALAPLRRLAIGHWLRRWWPASVRDGIVDLDIAVLDAELAVLTAAAQDYFAEDTFDSDIDGLLRPHRDALARHLRAGDPRVTVLVESCLELAEWSDVTVEAIGERRRDDYALAAGDSGSRHSGAIASGSASVSWSAVPPGVFDAAEDTVTWSAAADRSGVVTAAISVGISMSAAGVPVSLRSDELRADGVLDARGRAELALPVAESVAWNRDWSTTEISVGGPVDPGESREVRDRIRAFARSRLAVPAPDAFLAEILAAEADY